MTDGLFALTNRMQINKRYRDIINPQEPEETDPQKIVDHVRTLLEEG